MAVDSVSTSPAIADSDVKSNTNALLIKTGPNSDNCKPQSSSSSSPSSNSGQSTQSQLHSIDAILGRKAAAAAAAIDKMHQQQNNHISNLVQHGNPSAAAAFLHHHQQQQLFHLNQHFQNYSAKNAGNQLQQRLHSLYNNSIGNNHHENSSMMQHQQFSNRMNPFTELIADYQQHQHHNSNLRGNNNSQQLILEDEDGNNNKEGHNSDSDIESQSQHHHEDDERLITGNTGEAARRGLKRKFKKMHGNSTDLAEGKLKCYIHLLNFSLKL